MNKIISEKRGLSPIIATVFLILLVMISIGIVWASIKGILGGLDKPSSCLKIFDQVKLNNGYTCYDNDTDITQVSIEIGKAKIDGILIILAGEGSSKSYEITDGKNDTSITFAGSGGFGVLLKLPEENSGLTYLIKQEQEIETVKISPIANNQQCDPTDSMEIEKCDDSQKLTP